MAETEQLRVAKEAAQAGGDAIMRFFRASFKVSQKREDASYDLVSDADLAAEEAILGVLRKAYPDHAIMAEESHRAAATDAEHLWVVDPVDGTNNFVHAIPHFAVSIGYYRRGVAECAVVFNPARGDWFTASRGSGAWHNGEPLRVNNETQLDKVLVGVGFYYDRGEMMEATLDSIRSLFRSQIHGIRRFGTASLDLCHVAGGMFGGYFEYELSPWDFAAGALIVEEAGGRVTTCDGAPLPLSATSLLASNGPVHEPLLEIVRR